MCIRDRPNSSVIVTTIPFPFLNKDITFAYNQDLGLAYSPRPIITKILWQNFVIRAFLVMWTPFRSFLKTKKKTSNDVSFTVFERWKLNVSHRTDKFLHRCLIQTRHMHLTKLHTRMTQLCHVFRTFVTLGMCGACVFVHVRLRVSRVGFVLLLWQLSKRRNKCCRRLIYVVVNYIFYH